MRGVRRVAHAVHVRGDAAAGSAYQDFAGDPSSRAFPEQQHRSARGSIPGQQRGARSR